jgi:hypothetical protein
MPLHASWVGTSGNKAKIIFILKNPDSYNISIHGNFTRKLFV